MITMVPKRNAHDVVNHTAVKPDNILFTSMHELKLRHSKHPSVKIPSHTHTHTQVHFSCSPQGFVKKGIAPFHETSLFRRGNGISAEEIHKEKHHWGEMGVWVCVGGRGNERW